MTQAEQNNRPPRRIDELHDVYDFLDEVRLRPGMFVRGGSLQHLDSTLYGYRLAMGIHGIEEDFPFCEPGAEPPFSRWLCQRNGEESSLGWSTQIEREAEATGTPAIELFFSLLDQFRAEHDQSAR